MELTIKPCILTQNDCYRKGRYIRPRGVMVHSTGAANPYLRRYLSPDDGRLGEPSSRHWNKGGVGACVHAIIGKTADGSVAVYQTLPWTMRSWHCGRSGNDTHISFEICEDGLTDRAYFHATYQAAVDLTAYLCRRFRLDPLADGVVLCHSEGYRRGIASNHADVMHWWRKLPASDWAKAGLEQAKAAGITDGARPQGWCTRQEAALMILSQRETK